MSSFWDSMYKSQAMVSDMRDRRQKKKDLEKRADHLQFAIENILPETLDEDTAGKLIGMSQEYSLENPDVSPTQRTEMLQMIMQAGGTLSEQRNQAAYMDALSAALSPPLRKQVEEELKKKTLTSPTSSKGPQGPAGPPGVSGLMGQAAAGNMPGDLSPAIDEPIEKSPFAVDYLTGQSTFQGYASEPPAQQGILNFDQPIKLGKKLYKRANLNHPMSKGELLNVTKRTRNREAKEAWPMIKGIAESLGKDMSDFKIGFFGKMVSDKFNELPQDYKLRIGPNNEYAVLQKNIDGQFRDVKQLDRKFIRRNNEVAGSEEPWREQAWEYIQGDMSKKGSYEPKARTTDMDVNDFYHEMVKILPEDDPLSKAINWTLGEKVTDLDGSYGATESEVKEIERRKEPPLTAQETAEQSIKATQVNRVETGKLMDMLKERNMIPAQSQEDQLSQVPFVRAVQVYREKAGRSATIEGMQGLIGTLAAVQKSRATAYGERLSETHVEKLTGLKEVMERAQELEDAINVPGAEKASGRVDTWRNWFIKAVGGELPEPVTRVEQAQTAFANAMLRALSGAAVTEQEFQRIMNQIGDLSINDKNFRQKVQAEVQFIKDKYNARVRNYSASGYNIPSVFLPSPSGGNGYNLLQLYLQEHQRRHGNQSQ